MQGDFLINDWLVQPQINTVEKGGKHWHLEPKVMQVLVHLALHPREVLSKERLIDTIWRDTFVGDDVLVRCISEIRYVFGDDARSPSVIQTIPKAGYRLIASVTMEFASAAELLTTETVIRSSGSHHAAERPRDSLTNAIGLDDPPFPGTLTPPPLPNQTPRNTSPPMSTFPPLPRGTRASLRSSHPSHYLDSCRRRRPGPHCMGNHVVLAFNSPLRLQRLLGTCPRDPEPVLFCIADQNQYSFITLRDAAEPAKQVV